MVQDFQNRRFLIGVCGGIAAYKTVFLVRALKKLGAEVKVVMTDHATRFVTPLTFQTLTEHPVYTTQWDNPSSAPMEHIHLSRWAELFVIVPATANTLAKMAHGISDHLLSALYLATTTPVMVCPAMNQQMWQHPATQANIQTLQTRGVRIIAPEEGEAACRESGPGRLCDPCHLLHFLRLYAMPPVLAGQHCIITAGPTREYLDPVRYLSNESSGKMGFALAYAAYMAGASVTLITGPTALLSPPHVQCIVVENAAQMAQAVQTHLTPGCLFISAAAIADFAPTPLTQKIKKQNQSGLQLDCQPVPDLLSQVSARRLTRYLVGFAAETNDVIQNAIIKLQSKQLDLVIANEVGHGKGFHQTEHAVTLLTNTTTLPLPTQHKTRLAGKIIQFIATQLDAS